MCEMRARLTPESCGSRPMAIVLVALAPALSKHQSQDVCREQEYSSPSPVRGKRKPRHTRLLEALGLADDDWGCNGENSGVNGLALLRIPGHDCKQFRDLPSKAHVTQYLLLFGLQRDSCLVAYDIVSVLHFTVPVRWSRERRDQTMTTL